MAQLLRHGPCDLFAVSLGDLERGMSLCCLLGAASISFYTSLIQKPTKMCLLGKFINKL